MKIYLPCLVLSLFVACGSFPPRQSGLDGSAAENTTTNGDLLQIDGALPGADGEPADSDDTFPGDTSTPYGAVPIKDGEGEETWVEVCNVTSHLNLRSGPGTSYSVIDTLPPGATALLLDDGSGTWWKIEYKGQQGWAHSDYLCPVSSANIGPFIDTMWNTYYYLANENDYTGAKTTTLYDANCNALVKVSASFSDAVCIEGSGKLSSGEVINYAKSCSCGRSCPTGGIVCYKKLPVSQFPWGEGAYGNALVPFRSIAVDTNVISLKSVIYIKEWDGVTMPSVGSIGSFAHDGCFRADDIGGAIKGDHFDFFAGTKQISQVLEGIYPTKSTFSVYYGGSRCAYLSQP